MGQENKWNNYLLGKSSEFQSVVVVILAYEKKQEKVNETPAITENAPSAPTTSEAARTTVNDPVQAAKSLLGQTSIVTNAQKGRTYTGEILQVGGEYAVQRIGTDRGIIHNLNKMTDLDERDALLNLSKDEKSVSISYDDERRASLKIASREEERESTVSR